MSLVSSTSAAIEARGIGKVFGRGELAAPALFPTDITVERGQVLVIMGPSGSGKTTLLSILGLVLTPSEGEVLVDGRSMTDATPDEMTIPSTIGEERATNPFMRASSAADGRVGFATSVSGGGTEGASPGSP